MKVLEVSPEALALLLLASVCHGAAMAVCVSLRDVWMGLGRIVRSPGLRGAVRLPLREYAEEAAPENARNFLRAAELFLWDLLLCLVGAFSLFCLNFIFNDGKFRLFTVIASFLSFAAADRMLGKLLRTLWILPIRIVRRILLCLSAPAAWLIRGIFRVASRWIGRIRAGIRKKKIRRNTVRVMARLGSVGENGLIFWRSE